MNPSAHISIMLRSCIPHDTLSLAPFILSPQDPINLSFSLSPARPHSSPSGPPSRRPAFSFREVGRKTFIVSGQYKPPTREKVPAYQDSEWRRRERAHVRSSCNAHPRVEGSKNTRARARPPRVHLKLQQQPSSREEKNEFYDARFDIACAASSRKLNTKSACI